ncbi:MAG: hypothetical protein JW924_03275 [Fusobacteriaceae bacterium]|nr:hypothetical protein [Fusobacteriaceae bacterium]
MTNLTIAVNHDTQDLPYGSSAVDWLDIAFNGNLSADALIFSSGSDTVKDGEPIPSETDLNQAGTIIDEVDDTLVPYCFLADTDVGFLKQIMGYALNKRYVFCASFDGATASEPVLELWDDENHNSRNLISLGAGVADDSWWYGKVTTDGYPGADWVGTRLAGNVDGYFLWLNNQNGALSGAKNLYWNLKLIIPGGIIQSGLEQPVIAIKFLSN